MEVGHVKWFDVSSWGAKLKVLPANQMRDRAITCIDVTNKDLFREKITQNTDEGWKQLSAALVKAQFQDTPIAGWDDATGRKTYRFFSAKQDFSFSELRAIFPGLETSLLIDMPKDRIIESPEVGGDSRRAWEEFTLFADASLVYTPKINHFAATSYEESKSLKEVKSELTKSELFRGVDISLYSRMDEILGSAQYRSNALIEYYPDLDSALRDGRYGENDLKKVKLPYVAPIWVDDNNRVIGVLDIRHCPEMLAYHPSYFYGHGGRSFVISALLDAKEVRSKLEETLNKWNVWTANIEEFREIHTDKFERSVQSVALTLYEAHQKHDLLPPFNSLNDVVARSEGRFQAVGLDEMAGGIYGTIKAIRAYIPSLGDEAATVLADQVNKLHSVTIAKIEENRLKDVDVQRAREIAEVLEKAAINRKSDEVATSAGERQKHVDVGEKIGGARKDFARRALTIEDLESMNNLERKTSVIKKNIWPPLDYKEMRASGVSPEAAMAVKFIKDKLNVSPETRSRFANSVEYADENYIQAISIVRDLMANVKTVSDVARAAADIHKISEASTRTEQNGSIHWRSFLQDQWGHKASKIFSECDYFKGLHLPGSVQQEIRRKVPADNDNPGSDKQWKYLIKPSAVKSEEELANDKDSLQQDRELHRPHLQHVVRSSHVDLRQGRDVTASDLMDTFGFRAVEWGNWLPQDERQDVINMAYDAFSDLAEALELPPKALALDGKTGGSLAVAFGARGSGGRHAALAHFERERFVINLTRINGAGCLAHEFAHARDWFTGHKALYAFGKRADTAAGHNLFRVMHNRASTENEIAEKAEGDITRCVNNAISWLSHATQKPADNRDHLSKISAETIEEIRARIYGMTVHFLSEKNDTGSHDYTHGALKYTDIINIKEAFKHKLINNIDGKVNKKSRDGAEGNIYHAINGLALSTMVSVSNDMGVSLPKEFLAKHKEISDYHKNAKKLDELRSKPYWATPHEMFARAFAAYVQDKLEEKGIRSDYLVYGAGDVHIDNPLGNPNPAGLDRKRINEAFDAVVNEYRLEYAKYVGNNPQAPVSEM